MDSVTWTRVPKTVFVSLETFKFRVYDVISCFNVGNVTKCQVLMKISITSGHHCVKSMKDFDEERARDRERKLSKCYKNAPKRNINAKRKLEECYKVEKGDNPSDKPGFYSIYPFYKDKIIELIDDKSDNL